MFYMVEDVSVRRKLYESFVKESPTSFFPVLKQQMQCSSEIFLVVCYEKIFRQKTISLAFMIGKQHFAPFWSFPMEKRKNY